MKLQDECYQVQDVPLGNHVLTIKTDPKNSKHTSYISHIIVL